MNFHSLGAAFADQRLSSLESGLDIAGKTGSLGLSYVANTFDVLNNPSPRTVISGLGGFSAGVLAGDATFRTFMESAGIAATAAIDAPVVGVALLAGGQ